MHGSWRKLGARGGASLAQVICAAQDTAQAWRINFERQVFKKDRVAVAQAFTRTWKSVDRLGQLFRLQIYLDVELVNWRFEGHADRFGDLRQG